MPKRTDNAIQEVLRAVKEKNLSIPRAAGAFSVAFSCLQNIIQEIKTKKYLKKRRGETIFSCEEEKQLVDRCQASCL